MRDLPGIDCEVTFVEDEDFLDGASNYKIRKRHRKWAESAIRDENPRWEPPEKTSWWHGNPRYDYFVTLDALPLWYNQMSTPLDDQRSFKLHATDWFRKKGLEMLNFNSWDVMEWRRHRGWVKLRMNWFQMDLYEDLWGREPGDALQRIKWKRERDEDTIRLYLGGKWRYD
ncbi:hypothetical protein CkaCkLH20_09246 [Colletotrichum karsti]|uniref:Uncharacterized protein n=1 Tax=Colletotrichum karsti TaxID=1095194 RepID=A0A9P6LHC7_9PEZI|nr:uncharacterized protein CkaCkLH20_09246 [Colletotrichum karsti]KAF9873433.1 hypothetical protein CkaCkLH20_09246 [Colletotrichum karsti]